MVKRERSNNAGFTLVELMIVVAIIGILASIAIPAFSRYVKRSRSAEAVGHLNKMWAGAVSYYETDHMTQAAGGAVALARQFPNDPSGTFVPTGVTGAGCCGAPGDKCPGGDTHFNDPTWLALNFSIPDPYNYRPSFTTQGTGAAATFVASATGDLDCDTTVATYSRSGGIGPMGDVFGGSLPVVTNPLE